MILFHFVFETFLNSVITICSHQHGGQTFCFIYVCLVGASRHKIVHIHPQLLVLVIDPEWTNYNAYP